MQKYTLYRSSCLNITRTFFALGFSLKFPKLLILSLPTPHAICTPCLKNIVIILDVLKIRTKMKRFLTMKHPNNFCISYLQGEGKKLLSGLRMMEKKTFNNICCKVFFFKVYGERRISKVGLLYLEYNQENIIEFSSS